MRRATVEDAPELARVHVAAWQEAYRGIAADSHLEKFTIESRTEHFRKFLTYDSKKTSSGETWVVESDSHSVGFLTLGGSRDSDATRRDTGEIWGIYLSPGYWRKGIGRYVCEQGEIMLAARGYTMAILWVLELNQRARRFYEAMGFESDDISKEVHLGIPLKALRYRKELK